MAKALLQWRMPTNRVLDRYRAFAKTWRRRVQYALARFSYLCAEYLLAQALARIPETPRWKGYKESLRVGGLSEGGYAVAASSPERKIKASEIPSALVYVRARARVKITDPSIAILQKYSPWTWDTLPMTPPKAQAKVIVRAVHPREASEVASQRAKERPRWAKELTAAGVSLASRGAAVSALEGEEDVAYTALQSEMGLSTAIPPHWRPAIREIKRGVYRRFLRDPLITRALTDPKFRVPSNPPAPPISASQLRAFKKFQDSLAMS